MSTNVIHIRGNELSAQDVHAVAVRGATVALDSDQLRDVRATYERVQQWGEAKYPIYGVNTGFGELIPVIVPPQYRTELQENLLRSHAAGGGAPFSDDVVRAIMVVRLNCLMKGYSGASPQTLELLATLLNRHIHPIIPRQGSLGASGDLAPLSHMALALIGEGRVRKGGAVRPAAEVLAAEGLLPVRLGFKEGLALVNGTSAMTGAACLAVVRAWRLLRLAIVASADIVQCMRASTRAFDHRGHALKNHGGQIAVAALLRRLLEGTTLTREHGDIMRAIHDKVAGSDDVIDTEIYLQNAYSLRCMPQILGVVVETLRQVERFVAEEANSTNDNPVIFEDPFETFHGGNFHGQYVATACDQLNTAIATIGVMAERQLNRLVDPHLNAPLPPFLSHKQTGLFCGFEGAQYLATSIASENLDLAAPASIKSIPSNGSNQDVVSMGLIAARKSLRLCDNVNSIVTVLLAACHQAAQFIEGERFSPPVAQVHELLATRVRRYDDSWPIADLVDDARELLTDESGAEVISSLIDWSPLAEV